jgi:NAD(P)-dependent dehydrogenase (short-subunit alcohol dehydrogenase family)
VQLEGVLPVRLDVTDQARIDALARELGDVDVLINNVGIATPGALLDAGAEAELRRMMDTNLFGIYHLSRAFAPVLAGNGGGAFVNVLSVASWISRPNLAAYAVTKAAAWSLTNGIRDAVRADGTQVLGVHVGFIDTDLTRGMDVPKLAPGEVVDRVYAALEAGDSEVLVDELTRQVKQGLAAQPGLYTLAR